MKYTPPPGSTDPNAPYTNGNKAQGVKGSPVAAEAVENPQREIVAAIAATNQEPTNDDNAQLLEGMRRYGAGFDWSPTQKKYVAGKSVVVGSDGEHYKALQDSGVDTAAGLKDPSGGGNADYWETFNASAQDFFLLKRLTEDLHVHVEVDGSDVDGDGTQAKPWATIQHALNAVASFYYLGEFDVNIVVGNGTFDGVLDLPTYLTSSGVITVKSVNAVNTILEPAFVNNNSSNNYILSTLTLKRDATTHGAGHITQAWSSLTVDNCILVLLNGNNANNNNVLLSQGGTLTVSGSTTIQTSGQLSIFRSVVRGLLRLTGPIAFSGSCTYNVNTSNVSLVVIIDTPAFTGSMTGQRYLVTANAVCYTSGGGVNKFPGSTAGTTTTGGQYV